ncbi:hypothetical protein [Ekhidna sp. To15]|uniref:hypothetical protein n=1 Tax=Ekhidna sp. To15 TaxID=3395267 RepID=UPI003F526CFE
MDKIKNLTFIHLLIATVLIGCSSEDPLPETPINFDLFDARAIVFKQASSDDSNINGNLFKVDNSGKISAVIDSATVTFARTFSKGLYVEIREDGAPDVRRFYVYHNSSYLEIEDEINGEYKGENENGDLIFSDVSILRASSLEIDKLETTLDFPTVQSLSGNLAIITDNSVFQIFNTVSNVRYNVNGCNGPRMEAFPESTMAILDDCSNQILIDISNGNRTVADISSWNHESLRVSDGIIVLNQAMSEVGDFTNYALGHFDTNGNLSVLTENIFQPGSSSCMNCGLPNEVLFGNDEYLVVRELNKISLVNRNENNSISTILDGYNVSKVSLGDHLIYYLAEDNLGNPLIGVYDILNKTNQVLDSETSFDEIQTF